MRTEPLCRPLRGPEAEAGVPGTSTGCAGRAPAAGSARGELEEADEVLHIRQRVNPVKIIEEREVQRRVAGDVDVGALVRLTPAPLAPPSAQGLARSAFPGSSPGRCSRRVARRRPRTNGVRVGRRVDEPGNQHRASDWLIQVGNRHVCDRRPVGVHLRLLGNR